MNDWNQVAPGVFSGADTDKRDRGRHRGWAWIDLGGEPDSVPFNSKPPLTDLHLNVA